VLELLLFKIVVEKKKGIRIEGSREREREKGREREKEGVLRVVFMISSLQNTNFIFSLLVNFPSCKKLHKLNKDVINIRKKFNLQTKFAIQIL